MNWDGPHCPSWTGGVAATSIKVAKHRLGADGVVVQIFCSSLNNHPVCADSGSFAIFSFWHSHPSCPGGAMGLNPIRSHLHRPPLHFLDLTSVVLSLSNSRILFNSSVVNARFELLRRAPGLRAPIR